MIDLKVCENCVGWLALAEGAEDPIALLYGILLPGGAGLCKTQGELGKGVITCHSYTCGLWGEMPPTYFRVHNEIFDGRSCGQ